MRYTTLHVGYKQFVSQMSLFVFSLTTVFSPVHVTFKNLDRCLSSSQHI